MRVASGTLNLSGGTATSSTGIYRAAGDGATPAYLKFTGGTATFSDEALLDGSGISFAGATVQAGGAQHQLQLSDGTTVDLTSGTLAGPVRWPPRVRRRSGGRRSRATSSAPATRPMAWAPPAR